SGADRRCCRTEADRVQTFSSAIAIGSAMPDPNYQSIDIDAAIGGQVRRSGIGLLRPLAVVAAIAGVGLVLYFLLTTGEKEQVADNTPREEFRPVQAPRNEGFNAPSPPPLPTV